MSATSTDSVMQEARERLRRRERTREKERAMRDLDKSWRAFIDSTKGIPESLMDAPGVEGDWSVKDVLSHVAAWDRVTTRVVLQILRGDEPEWPLYEQKFNDLNYEADRALSVTEARNRALSSHKALVEMLDGKGEVRGEWIRPTTIDHYPEHTEAIVRWREAQGILTQPLVRSVAGADEGNRTSTSTAQPHVAVPEGTTTPVR